jgi:hypothetical protein
VPGLLRAGTERGGRMKKLDVTKEEAVKRMVDSLLYQAEYHNKSLEGLTIENMNYFLDDLFEDGGEIRCEKFTDLAMEYALQFGELESSPFNNKQWDCIKSAIKIISRRQS